MNTPLHLTRSEATTLYHAVQIAKPDWPADERRELVRVENMLKAALLRLREKEERRNRTGVWA